MRYASAGAHIFIPTFEHNFTRMATRAPWHNRLQMEEKRLKAVAEQEEKERLAKEKEILSFKVGLHAHTHGHLHTAPSADLFATLLTLHSSHPLSLAPDISDAIDTDIFI